MICRTARHSHDGKGRLVTALGYERCAVGDEIVPTRLFVVHSLFGHSPPNVAALAASLRPARSFFWLHDYATLCTGYNLLRDDAVFCGAPAETSMACRICVYGEDRARHRARVRELFDQVAFDVIAPSETALAIWLRGAEGIRRRATRVHPNALLRKLGDGVAKDGPVRIGFIGYPNPAKGWMLFLELFRRLRGDPDYAFFQFSNPEVLRPMPGLTCVAVQVDRFDRLAMANLTVSPVCSSNTIAGLCVASAMATQFKFPR